jgi:hypothetical protein
MGDKVVTVNSGLVGTIIKLNSYDARLQFPAGSCLWVELRNLKHYYEASSPPPVNTRPFKTGDKAVVISTGQPITIGLVTSIEVVAQYEDGHKEWLMHHKIRLV